jgi:polyhydroxybutyrate depolymerase
MAKTPLGWLFIPTLLLGACSDGGSGGGNAADASPDPAPDAGDPIEQRPYNLLVPDGHDAKTPAPLVLLLHGYTSSGAVQLGYFGFADVAEEQDILVAYPDGTVDGNGNPFWNATDACCDLEDAGVDDVAYLTAVLDDVAENYAVDPARVFVIGHSNGGFMSHRMACDRADRIAAIASLAGATWADPALCQPSEPVAILEVHGDNDNTIGYDGGEIQGDAYPSAPDTVTTWADKNGCTGELETGKERLDLDTDLEGAETRVERFAGCPGAAAEVELWTLEGAGHVPNLARPGYAEAIAGFLLAHPKE